ncbi:MAG: radical SAM protein [Planctomycetota bacterium]|nr:radical SAM protein [Planctomycetota bacterium]
MKVLHISPTLPQEALGPMYLSRAAKDAGHEMKALLIPDPLWLKKVKEYNPDVITWSLMTGSHKAMFDVNRILKSRFDFFSLMGGPHVTFVPDCVKQPEIDAVCIGEGEGAIVELLDKMEAGEDIRSIPNLVFADPDQPDGMLRNAPRPLIQDLDALGLPDRSLLYDAGPIYANSPRKVIVTQRGCPMMCSFCFHHAWKRTYGATNKQYVRKRSVSHVIEEVNYIRANWPLDFVHFLDDIFNLKDDWLEEFAERWPKEVGLPFDCILMANIVKEKQIKLLKKAGCVYSRIAFEAASDFVRNTVFRKNTEKQHLIDASRWIKENGIRLGSLNMLGGPGGTIEDDFETIKLNIDCGVDHPLASIVQPYPEFDLNEITEGLGVAVAEYDDFPANFNREATIQVVDKEKIENLHKWFPILVRFPRLLPFAQKTLGKKWLSKPLLIMYMLYSEWLVTEQNVIYNRAQGIKNPLKWAPIDFTVRCVTKGVIRAVSGLGIKFVKRWATKLEMGDERVQAHMD